jgi:hypothetical protein
MSEKIYFHFIEDFVLRNIHENENGEVLGEFVLEILNRLYDLKSDTIKILKKYGIQDLEEIKWYPFEDWIRGFREISKEIGPTRLYIMGTGISENIEEPVPIDSLKKAFDLSNRIYQKKHRKIEFGKFELLNFDDVKREAEIMSDTPYPCDFERGIIMGMANKHRPYDSKNIWVVHKDFRECRKKGFERCKYFIKW